MNCNNNQSDFPDTPQEHENYYNFDTDISITELKIAIKSLKCNKAVGIDDLNGKLTEWFDVSCGLKQGCSLSSILFNLYFNDLIIKINSLDIGIEINGEKVCILAYADDVVLLAENENELQVLMNELNIWCEQNKLEVNVSKS